MRFGKKLFLHMAGDESGAPYLSNKQLKEVINQIVRELRQWKQAASSQGAQDGALRRCLGSLMHGEPPGLPAPMLSPLEVNSMKHAIKDLNKHFFVIIDSDLDSILNHIVLTESEVINKAALMQEEAIAAGIAFNDRQIRALERVLMCRIRDKKHWVATMVRDAIEQNPTRMAERIALVNAKFSALAATVNAHVAYLEINVAGFRKLLKRHDRQVPKEFHHRPSPFLGYHNIVTPDFEALHREVADFRQTLVELSIEHGIDLAVEEVQDWGPECQMVMTFRGHINDVSAGEAVRNAYAKPCADGSDDD